MRNYGEDAPEYYEYMETLNAEATRHTYRYHLVEFLDWTQPRNNKISSYKELATSSKEKLTRVLRDYLIYKKRRVRENTIKASSLNTAIRSIESFLEFHERVYGKKQLNKMIPKMNRPSGNKAYALDEIEIMFNSTTRKRNKALILFFPACGGRRASISQLQIKHMIPIENCYALRIYADDVEDETAEYITFVTPEAREVFDGYLEERVKGGETVTPESYAFVNLPDKHGAGLPLQPSNINRIMQCVIKRSTLKRQKAGNNPRRYQTSQVHGFRHFFRTALSKAKVVYEEREIPIIAQDDKKKLMGHRATTDLDMRYYDAEIPELFKEYKKAIPYLTIQRHLRQETTIKELRDESIKNETQTTKEMDDLKMKVATMQAEMQVKKETNVLNREEFINQLNGLLATLPPEDLKLIKLK